MLIDSVRATYGVIDNTIKVDTITPSSSDLSEFAADLSSTLENETKQKLAYLEQDYFLLDGNYIFPEIGKKYFVGFESANIADAAGNIDAYVEYLFGQNHVSYGTTLIFPNNCAAKDFTIIYYADNTVLASKSFVDNTETQKEIYEQVEGWNRVRIVFSKVNAYQRARLSVIIFGVNIEISPDLMIEVSANKATDMSSDYFSSGEVSISFYNDGSVFNVANIRNLPLSLQTALRISLFVRLLGQESFVPWTEYFSSNTTISEDGEIVTISGYDNLYELSNTTYTKGVVYPDGRSLGEWAKEVADDAGFDIEIDGSFYGKISKGYISEVPHREALRLIAEAGCGRLRNDENGLLHLEPNTIGDLTLTLTKDDIVQDSYTTENQERILGVAVSKHTYIAPKESVSAVELGHIESVLITDEPQEIEVVYGDYPVVTSTVAVFVNESTSAMIDNVRVYSERVVFTLTGTAGDETWVTVTGKAYSHASTPIEVGTATSVKTIDTNYLLTDDLAQEVAEYQLSIVANKYEHTAEIVTEDDVDLGQKIKMLDDTVVVENVGFSLSYTTNEVTVKGVDVGKIDN